MGIRGLQTYVEPFLQPFNLQNTTVAVDGNALVYYLCLNQKDACCSFGGEYDKFSQTISNFFDDLVKCNINPLVILDGGNEGRRLPKAKHSLQEKIDKVFWYNTSYQNQETCYPVFMKEVFKEVMEKRKIKCVQGLFEGDYNVASLARFLDCPVLSRDSDYYIYGVKYIPLHTLESNITKTMSGYAKKCKIYDVVHLLQRFPGLEAYHLPLIAALVGNDYVEANTFANFYGNSRNRIDMAINFLKGKSIHSAISQLLSRVDQRSRKEKLEVLEININMYTTSNPEILTLFGYSKQFALEAMKKVKSKPFKFKDDFSAFLGMGQSNIDEAELEINHEEDDPEFLYALNIYKVAPAWFIKEFYKGRYVAQFVDILTRRLYFCPVLIENYSYPSVVMICQKILTVIYTLLAKDLQGPKSLTIYCRGMGSSIITHQLELKEKMPFGVLPNLFNLRHLSLDTRKQILNETLEIPENKLEDIPDEWKLFVATVCFWMSQEEKPGKTNYHLYSLLFGMLFGVVDRNIGYYRDKQKLLEKCGHIDDLKKQPSKRLKMCSNLAEAYNSVTKEDCFLVAPFFVEKFKVDKNILSYSKKFDISVVHVFSQFQICLWNSMQLNALLELPYEQTKVSEMFNGTLLYNLYCDFQEKSDIDTYITQLLKDSPSLLNLFTMLLNKVKDVMKLDVLMKMIKLN